MKTTAAGLLLLSTLSLLAACGPEDSGNRFTHAYLEALQARPGATVRKSWLDHFVSAYGDFGGKNLPARLRDLYAPEFYFNDTLRSLHEREALVRYLGHTAGRLESMELTVLGRQYQGPDAYLRWTMRTRFSAGWRDVDVTTLGMTHLRFNEQGKVILHQDFWDSRQGLFGHIPILGGIINRIRKGL